MVAASIEIKPSGIGDTKVPPPLSNGMPGCCFPPFTVTTMRSAAALMLAHRTKCCHRHLLVLV